MLGHTLLRVVVRRLILTVPLMLVVSVITFLLVSLTPGDPARQILGATATPAQYTELHHALGLDLALYEQYWRWVERAFHGDLGASLHSRQAVTTSIDQHLPVTLFLITGAL